MTHEDFKNKLKLLDLTIKQFAERTSLSYTTPSNWTKKNAKVPAWVELYLDRLLDEQDIKKYIINKIQEVDPNNNNLSGLQNLHSKNLIDLLLTSYDKQIEKPKRLGDFAKAAHIKKDEESAKSSKRNSGNIARLSDASLSDILLDAGEEEGLIRMGEIMLEIQEAQKKQQEQIDKLKAGKKD